MTICIIEECSETVAVEVSSDGRSSKVACLDHSSKEGFLVECSLCGKHIKRKLSNEVRRLSTGKPFVCKRCFMAELSRSEKVLANSVETISRINSSRTKEGTAALIEKMRSLGYYGEGGSLGGRVKHCYECDKETRHVGDRCFDCDPWESGRKKSWSSLECDIHGAADSFLVEKYECWECLKAEFKPAEHKLELESSFWQSTYRLSKESRRGQFMMERELVERGVGWFVYIKGYIDPATSAWVPLVIGKTGSRIVNQTRTDISFKMGKASGRFLQEEGLAWDTSKILVIPYQTELVALQEEARLQKELKLLGS